MILSAFQGRISPANYPFAAAALLLAPHAAVAIAFEAKGVLLRPDTGFWLLPLRRLSALPGDFAVEAALVFAAAMIATCALASISFKRAGRSGIGFGLALLTVMPGLQLATAALVALLPFSRASAEESDENADQEPEDRPGAPSAYMLQGILAGVSIIVLAVLLSAMTFGAYGWGLFVLTPFVVGVTTAYLANRKTAIARSETILLVLGAAALGGFALMIFALEGLVCILLIAPLAAGAAVIGGLFGRAMALARNDLDRPVMAVAILPAVFAFEAALPPSVGFATDQAIEIAAPPAAVWSALASDSAIAAPPGLVGAAGLAYPLRGEIVGEGVGAERLGHFSTGSARERITEWIPGRKLAFTVLSQPPAMEEMSPYRRVHAPHVEGYFETGETSFELEPLASGGTRLTARASHVLRLDPLLYWEPLARWAVRQNTGRVLRDIKSRAEAMR